MDAAGQVIVILKVLLHVGPVAAYFIALGLVNSQSTPKVVDARSDFLALTFACCPLLFWPVPALIQAGLSWVALVGLVLLVPLFLSFTRGMDCDWVVYNISDFRARRDLERAAQRLGWTAHWDGSVLGIPDVKLTARLSVLPILRNVTVHTDARTPAQRNAALALREQFAAAVQKHQLLPSLTGSCLLMLGIGLLMVPLWMMSHHSDAIAEVVNRWLVS